MSELEELINESNFRLRSTFEILTGNVLRDSDRGDFIPLQAQLSALKGDVERTIRISLEAVDAKVNMLVSTVTDIYNNQHQKDAMIKDLVVKNQHLRDDLLELRTSHATTVSRVAHIEVILGNLLG